jgi:hypothetical protein
MVTGAGPHCRPTMEVLLPDYHRGEGAAVKKWVVLASATAGAAVFVAVLAGKDDIRRLWLMHNM